MNKASALIGSAVAWLAVSSLACQNTMRIGTYAINNYAGNGSSASMNMSQNINLANYFYSRAQALFPTYSPCPVIPSQDFPARTDAQVTKAHLIDGTSGDGKRESAD